MPGCFLRSINLFFSSVRITIERNGNEMRTQTPEPTTTKDSTSRNNKKNCLRGLMLFWPFYEIDFYIYQMISLTKREMNCRLHSPARQRFRSTSKPKTNEENRLSFTYIEFPLFPWIHLSIHPTNTNKQVAAKQLCTRKRKPVYVSNQLVHFFLLSHTHIRSQPHLHRI